MTREQAAKTARNILFAFIFAVIATGLAMAATWDPMAFPKQSAKINHHTADAILTINPMIPTTIHDNVGATKNIAFTLPSCIAAHEGVGTTFLQTSNTYTITVTPAGGQAILPLGTDNQTITIPAVKGNRMTIRCNSTDWWIVDHNGTLTAS